MTRIYVPILEYHDLCEQKNKETDFHSPYVMQVSKFYEQIEWLYQNRYSSITLDDLLKENIPEKSFVLTFDDGNISNYEFAFPILKKFNFVGTFFIIPTLIDKKNYITRKQIHEMDEKGMKFESHSLTHPYILSLSRQEITREVHQSKEKIQKILNREINHFSVPYGFYNKYLIQCVKEAGYKSIVTEDFGYYKPKYNSFQILPRFTVKSQMNLNTFTNIVQKKKIKLLSDYSTAILIQTFKRILGYRNYIYLKSLILKTVASQINEEHR